MIKLKTIGLFAIIFSYFLLFSQCTADQLPEPQALTNCDDLSLNYQNNIAPIIENSCAYNGCHLGTAPGIFESYEGLLGVLDKGWFMERVITLKDDPNLGMPPNYAPAERPKDLTEEELQLIRCWVEAGYPN